MQLDERSDDLGTIGVIEQLASAHRLTPRVEPRTDGQQQRAAAP